MLFSLIVALVVILLTAFWVTQGLLYAAVMFVDSVLACMVAFGFHESLHALWADAGAMQAIGQPIALMAIFLVTLVVLRLGTDKLIGTKVVFPVHLDRIGAGVCGFFTGMVLVGTSLVAIQMLPVGATVFGYDRLENAGDRTPRTRNLGLFNPDAFVVGLVDVLSTNGRFGGGNAFETARTGLLLDLYAARSSPQPQVCNIVPDDCLILSDYWETRQIETVEQTVTANGLERKFAPSEPSPLSKFLVCRVLLKSSAAAKGEQDVRFRLPQFRVVGPPPTSGESRAVSPTLYLACGMSDIYIHQEHGHGKVAPDQPSRLVRFSPQTDFLLNPKVAHAVASGASGYRLDVVFDVPEDFEPWYIEFKRGARAEFAKKMFRTQAPAPLGESASGDSSKPGGDAKQSGSPAADDEPASSTEPGEGKQTEEPAGADKSAGTDEAAATGGAAGADESAAAGGEKSPPVEVGAAREGRAHVADAIRERTAATAKLPIPLDAADAKVARCVRRGKLGEGHFWVELPNSAAPKSPVTELDVPDGKRMVQIGAEQCMPGNVLGRALNYAASVTAQINVTTTDGQRYFAQGVYSAAPADGQLVLEIQYWPAADVPERCLRPPVKLTRQVMEQAQPSQRRFGYFFLVDPGVQITGFSTGSGEPQPLRISVPA